MPDKSLYLQLPAKKAKDSPPKAHRISQFTPVAAQLPGDRKQKPSPPFFASLFLGKSHALTRGADRQFQGVAQGSSQGADLHQETVFLHSPVFVIYPQANRQKKQ